MFKVKKSESGFYGCLFIGGILLSVACNILPDKQIGILLSAIALTAFAAVAFARSLRIPIIAFSEKGFYIRSNLFLAPKFYQFETIREIRPLKSDHELEFITSTGNYVRLSIRRLSRKDRIRFIFLLESDVNRKHIG
jgi:uncharacterized membrane protein YobD (UPF0266 family)